jgi:lambda family phage tail tape measure protein
MSSQNDISLKLKLTAEGIKEATSDSEKLNSSLERGQTISKRPKAVSAGYKAASTTSENVDYGVARGTIGTGAGARDFAKESQGLGGLVRLYATWAANVFAVSAAFNALSSAANTTNMIKGMDQLGASSGVALGSLAKKFADATGGAISLQDAVSATTKAMSAGLSAKQFEQLGEVATKASRALGVNMTDAVSRLSRGITKIEPELLDELGLFTKVGQATDDYAKRIGKSASSLSDFEKRQAFANAVLKEGRDKFADINVEANPYDKLAASVKNLAQNGLELINKVLGPIINLLSSSPTALAGVLGGLGLMLLKQAIPAIGEYRQSLVKTADETTKKWQAKSDAIIKIEKDQYQYLSTMTDTNADNAVKKLESAQKRLKKAGAAGGFDDRAQSILDKTDYTSVTKSDKSYLRKQASEAEATGNKKLADSYREATNALNDWIRSEEKHANIQKVINAQVAKNIATASPLSPEGYARDQLERARKAKAKSSIISNVAEDASMGTFGEAWKKMNTSIKDEKLTGLDKVFTKVGGAAVLATTGITRVISALSGFASWVGIAITTLTTLYGWVSTNREEADKLSSALDYATETTKTATATFEKFSNTLTTQSLSAKANAMSSLADSVDETVTKFMEFNKASNVIDKTWESTKHLFGLFGGFSKQDYVVDSLSKQVMLMLDNLDDPQLKQTAEDKLKSLLSVDKIDLKSLNQSISKIDPSKLEEVPKVLEEIKTKSQASVVAIAALNDGFKNVNTAFTALENSLKSNDPLTAYADSIAKQSQNMVEAFKDPVKALVALDEILKDTSKLNAFPPEAVQQILAVSNQYADLNDQISGYKKNIDDLDKQIKTESNKIVGKSLIKIDELKFEKQELEVKIKTSEQSKLELSGVLKNAASTGLDQAFKILLTKFNSAAAQAALDQSKALVGYLPKSVGTIKLQMDLENKSIDIRLKEIQAVYALTQEMKISRVTTQLDNVKQKQSEARNDTQIQSYQPEIDRLQGELDLYKSKNIAGDVKSGKLPKTPLVYQELELQQGFNSQKATLVNQKLTNKQRAAVEVYIQELDDANKKNDDILKEKELANKALIGSTRYQALSLEQQDAENKKYLEETRAARELAATTEKRKNLDTTKKVIEVAGVMSPVGQQAVKDYNTYEDQLKAAKALFDEQEKIDAQLSGTALRQAVVTRDYDRQETLTQISLDNAKLKGKEDSDAIDRAQQLLDLQNGIGTISAQDYQTRSSALKSRKIEVDYAQQLLDIEEERRKKLADIKKQVDLAGGKENVEPGKLVQLKAEEGAANTRYTDQRANIEANTQALRDQQKAADEMSVRMKGMSDIVQGAFQNMGDALEEFTRTGKLDFQGLVNSMISDLVRFELRAQMLKMYENIGGLSGVVGAFMNAVNPVKLTPDLMPGYDSRLAKGAAYDYGVEAFARGGTFTNSIVDSPTMFKFARGTGLMGEAGPEAIMPLKRDSQGNLGVRGGEGGGNNVEVVVNNYGTEKAETRESTDSRGNRKIEVLIGEATSGDLNRSGSSTQKALGGTYGLRPQLIRR